MSDSSRQPAVGIDLGTTFSAVAFLDASGKPETIRNSEGDLTTPSAVFFDHNRPIVGIEAVEAGLLEPDRLALYAKRDVGEASYEKQIRGKHLPAEVIEALILRKLKADAELKLGEIEKAVITVPAFFNEPCRKATQDAGRLAGLDVLDIINEPTAAAITYGVQQGFLSPDGASRNPETVLVYDLGGGTFDVTVMKIENGNFNTIATAGDVYLGGIDWDKRVVDFIAEAFLKEHGVDPREDPQAEQELLRKANQTKHALTQRESVTVAFAHDGKRLRTELSQEEFSQRCDDLVERTLMTVQLVLDDAGVAWPNLTRLILVGGSTRMPMIRRELERLSGMELDRSLSPDEAVCHGAALYAGMLMAGTDDQSGISVSNVNSHDLGILAVDPKTGQPRRKIMIPRNSHLPARKMVRFRTHSDNQANVKIEIVEGGDDRGTNATRIGRCVVDDLPRGTPRGTNVDVRFDYARDGRLTVQASLPEIDRKITMTLDRAAGLTDDQMAFWSERLHEGVSDAMLAALGERLDAIDVPSGQNTESTESTKAEQRQTTESWAEPATGEASEQAADSSGEMSDSGDSFPDFSELQELTPDQSTAPSTPSIPDSLLAPAALMKSEAKAATENAGLEDQSSQPSGTDRTATAASVEMEPIVATRKTHRASDLKIDTGLPADENAAKVGAADLHLRVENESSKVHVVREKPQIDVGTETPSTKADANDLAMLAALSAGDEKETSSKLDVPLIVTNKDEKASGPADKPKKSGFFGRKKR
ncbi:Hsp70 family protein [Roseiconus lacunae]|uniref:Hsp70 family protein n=1 Tax=Roseiconus lacunae TaxID=2605694 RepID=UPI001E64BA7D|nr:Hsp70 family protein [Roseiconus lacunae]MCD0459754.1 Hsp70 family protein [Roseiconus lacunae]